MTKAQAKVPVLGDSVFVGFVTNGEGRMLTKQAASPFDKVSAVYSHTRKLKDGSAVHSVKLTSGDSVDVLPYKNYWKAIR